MPTRMTEVVYTCRGCGATDTVRLFLDEAPPLAITCWKCGAGRKFGNAAEQAASQIGMLPPAARERGHRA